MSGQSTDIGWCDSVWNPLRGCSRVSTGCEQCYAEKQAGRFSGSGQPYEGLVRKTSQGWKWTGEVRLIEKDLEVPLRWKKPKRIFVNSMSDVFHESVPDEWIARIFAVMASCGRHTFQILTKRPERMAAWFQQVAAQGPLHNNLYRSALIDFYQRKDVDLSMPYQVPTLPTPELRYLYDIADGIEPQHTLEERHRRVQGEEKGGYLQGRKRGDSHWRPWPLNNIWLGVSVENQATADERIPWLLKTPAAVRFVSYEPALEAVDFSRYLMPACPSCDVHHLGYCDEPTPVPLSWIIAGGESGNNARPCNMEWLRSVVAQCKAADVACWVKQYGALPIDSAYQVGTHAEHDHRSIAAAKALGMDHVGFNLVVLKDRKGADPSEWESGLQVQQFPQPQRTGATP